MLCHRFRPLLLVLALTLALPTAALRGDDSDRVRQNQELQARIAQLISALGSEEYAVRERAQNELARLGTVAFDDLLVARENPDIEISQRAQYLIERMGIELTDPNDSLEVRQILGDYESLDEENRIRRMQRLALLPDWGGASALCRLVRYDDTEHLSKTAALLLLEQEPPATSQRRDQLAETLDRGVQVSGRTGAQWVRGYAETLRDPEKSLPGWQAILEQEWTEYRGDPRQVERKLLRDLLRWQVNLLQETGHNAQAEQVMQSSLALVEPSHSDLLETIDWLLAQQAWPVIDQVYEQFGDVCKDDPELMYRLAEMRLKQGQPQEAQEIAALALALDSDNLQNHDLLARTLRSRGMASWAEAEYRFVLENVAPKSADDVWYRYAFADMLHDQQRDGEAAEMLEPVLEALSDPNIVNALMNKGLRANPVISRAHYYSACHFAQQGDVEKQVSHLRVAISRDPLDLDSIIALYNVQETNERQRQQTMEFLSRARELLWQHSQALELRLERDMREPQAEFARYELASYSNQYAWLVCNTEGDFQQALRASERSLELVATTGPRRAGYLDTLGHCHFALENYEQAVLIQSEAVELEPHSGQLRRALERFEAALAAQQAEENAE